MEKKKIGLFFGTFNPIHNGHIMAATQLANEKNMPVYFVPCLTYGKVIKEEDMTEEEVKSVSNDFDKRCTLVNVSYQNCLRVASRLPRPTRIIDALNFVSDFVKEKGIGGILDEDRGNRMPLFSDLAFDEDYKEKEIVPVPIIGIDNLTYFEQYKEWYHSEEILEKYGLIVISRPGYDHTTKNLEKGIEIFTPKMMANISSTAIREMVKNREEIDGLVDRNIIGLIRGWGMYQE
jgi:nicotinate-nucleotide adenylyltransferase